VTQVNDTTDVVNTITNMMPAGISSGPPSGGDEAPPIPGGDASDDGGLPDHHVFHSGWSTWYILSRNHQDDEARREVLRYWLL